MHAQDEGFLESAFLESAFLDSDPLMNQQRETIEEDSPMTLTAVCDALQENRTPPVGLPAPPSQPCLAATVSLRACSIEQIDEDVDGKVDSDPVVRGVEDRIEEEDEIDELPDVTASSQEDLAPIPPHLRTWRWWNFAAMWFTMAIGIPTYMLGASLLSLGLSWWQAVLAVFTGSLVTLGPLVLNGYVGTKYSISFPVYLRSCFGIHGAKAAAFMRGLVAIGWFSFQVWIGALAIYAMVSRIPWVPSHDVQLGTWMGITLIQLLCFLLFLGVHALLVLAGMNSLKWVQLISTPILVAGLLALFSWALSQVGLQEMLDATSNLTAVDPSSSPSSSSRSFGGTFMVGVTSVIASWSTLALNDLDFTRYAAKQIDPILGQSIVFPITMTIVAFIGIAVTGASVVLYGRPFWDPASLFSQWSSDVAVVIANMVLVISVLSINLTANLVSPANDFSNLWPSRITFKIGGYITCILGVAILPWKLFADANSFIFIWLIGYSPILGAICGIMLVDFWVLRRRQLLLPHLFEESNRSIYWFVSGWNIDAIAAWVLGPLPCAPGFLVAAGAIGPHQIPEWIRSLYDYSWFIALGVASLLYLLLSRRHRLFRWATYPCYRGQTQQVI